MTLTPVQILGITIIVLGVLSTSTAQLTDLFGPHTAKLLVSASGLLSTIFGGVVGFIGGQTGQLKQVQSMPGVDKIIVNEKANATLASLAVNEENPKIEAKPSAQHAVEETAKGN